MTSPFAEYELTSVPPIQLECTMAVGQRMVLDPHERIVVGRKPNATIFVRGSPELFALGWGGTENHAIECFNDQWQVRDHHHGKPLKVNGESLDGDRTLVHADRIEPATGFVFTFIVRDELEAVAAALSEHPEVLNGEELVLVDWILERATMTRGAAERAVQHFRYRLRRAGML